MCRQLGIIQYHPDVEVQSPKERRKAASTNDTDDSLGESPAKTEEDPVVPAVSVRLVQSLRLPPGHCAVDQVEVDGTLKDSPQMLEPDPSIREDWGLELTESVLKVSEGGTAHVVVTNNSGWTQQVASDTLLGQAVDTVIVAGGEDSHLGDTDSIGDDVPSSTVYCPPDDGSCHSEIWRVNADVDEEDRKRRLLEMVDLSGLADPEQGEFLRKFLTENHQVFSIDPGERGETDMVQFEVDTGDAAPRRQPVRRMPFAVRQEVANQLRDMQKSGVIQPSSNPWASPVLMVRKKDGSHRFCVNYRLLNSVTKPDLYPLLRIDDLLDQLGRSHYFSNLDLASGYWQIRVHPNSVEKTAFVTHQGLFEFQVMPFGLMNAPLCFKD